MSSTHNCPTATRGVALLATVIVITSALFAGAIGILHWTHNSYRMAAQKEMRAQLFYAAESGLEFAKARLFDMTVADFFDLDYVSNQFYTIAQNYFPPRVQLVHFSVGNVTTNQQISDGLYAGLGELINRYYVNCRTAEINNPDNAVELEMIISTRSVSPFQFAIFYNEDLEFHPGGGMTVSGRVHSNRNILLWPSGDLTFYDRITAAGIWAAGRTSMMPYFTDSRNKGNVYITLPTSGNTINLYQHTTPRQYFDSFDPLWTLSSRTNALNMLEGAVRDNSFGTSPLLLPFEGAQDNARLIIEPPSPNDSHALSQARYGNKATFVIETNNFLYYQTGPLTNSAATTRVPIGHVTNHALVDFIEINNAFYNQRQGYMIQPHDIDFEKFHAWLNSHKCPPQAYNEFMGTNHRAGIIYVNPPEIGSRSAGSTNAGLRLVNATRLPRSMTLATPVGLYTWGDFNTRTHVSADDYHSCVLIADAFTILSKDWTDAANQDDNNTYRVRQAVTLNTAIIVGNSTSTVHATGGGIHNLPRLMENWSGRRFTLNGSIICLFASDRETGPHIDVNPPYYTVPHRDLVYDPRLADPESAPPGFLGFYEYVTHEWRQIH